MICYHPASRAERRNLYIQTLKSSRTVTVANYDEYRAQEPNLCHQLHVDSKRALWHFLRGDDLVEHLKTEGIESQPIQHESAFTRFHQRYLELFNIDVMYNMKDQQYFQGLNQILAAVYFVFLKEEYLTENAEIMEYISNYDKEINDFTPVSIDLNKILHNYELLLQITLNLCETSLSPLFEPDLQKLSKYVQLTFEPYMRLIDARTYEIISKSQELREIAPSILMGAMLSGLQYNVNTIQNSLRFLDSLIHGDYILQIFISCAALSLSVRYRNPSLFPNCEFKLALNATDKIIGLQIAQNQDDDILFRVMSSMEHGEKIIKDFADQCIRLGLVAYYISKVAHNYTSKVFQYIASEYDIEKRFSHIKYPNRQSIIQDMYCSNSQDLLKGIRGLDAEASHYVSLILNSITYDMENLTERVELNMQQQIQQQFITFGKNSIEAAKKTAKIIAKGAEQGWNLFKSGVQSTIKKLEQLKESNDLARMEKKNNKSGPM
ncbi:Conserved_hypothetical protein [Hexamita inflata]|uniref:Uncharacterized protein n=1 Tax=Hexamita inflata TaxID=28002 RepID=A0AA86TSD3_9EUKA|nr:Conserved hypothetical protein [Hexamita inflata]